MTDINLKALGIKPKKKVEEQKITEAILLSRVSSKKQEEMYSLDAQEKRLRDYCERKGLKVIGVYSFAESSTRGKRVRFMNAIKPIKARKTPVAIVCDKVDRLQRGFKETPMLEQLRVSGKAELHFLNDYLVLHKNSPSGDLLRYNQCVAMAQNYTDTISENVNRAHEQMVREGKAMGHAPIGYMNVRDNETKMADIVFDVKRAPLVYRLFQDYGTGGYSLDQMVDRAKELGLTNKTKGHSFIKKSQMAQILSNVFYCGYAKRNGEYYKHTYPVLVPPELFKKCVAVREKKCTTHANKVKHITTFHGMIKCQKCGCMVTPDIKKGKYIYLKPNSKKECDCKQISEEVANKLVESVFKSMSFTEEELRIYLKRLNEHFQLLDSSRNAEKQKLEKKLLEVSQRINRLQELFLVDETMDKSEYNNLKQSLLLQKKELEEKIVRLPNDMQETQITLEYLLDVASRVNSLYNSSRIEKKRKILSAVFSNFFLNGSKLSYDIKKPFEIFLKRSNRLLNWAAVDSNHRPHPYQGCALTT